MELMLMLLAGRRIGVCGGGGIMRPFIGVIGLQKRISRAEF